MVEGSPLLRNGHDEWLATRAWWAARAGIGKSEEALAMRGSGWEGDLDEMRSGFGVDST